MSADAASLLVQAAIASSAAALLIILLRKALRIAVGARAAYWIWLLLPVAALVVLVPLPERSVQTLTAMTSSPGRTAASVALAMINEVASPSRYATAVLGVWFAGALVFLAVILWRHRAFVRSLGAMSPQPDGSLRARTCKEPILFGILRPRIVLPLDFDSTYGPNERAMVLAHELAHWRRRDPHANAFAALWLSLSWFNPLMYWAHRLYRFDQELACDAAVLALPGATRRAYAGALLRAQLAIDLAGNRTMLGCLWHSFHPLAERIQMLKHPLPGETRRRAGLALMIACILSGCYAVRTTQSQAALQGAEAPLIAINMKAFINGAEVPAPDGSPAGWNVLVPSGGQFGIGDHDHWTNCSAQLTAVAGESRNSDGTAGDILLSCRISRSNTVFATPTLLMHDAAQASVVVTDSQENLTYRLEFNASTTAARIAAASAARLSRNTRDAKTFQLKRVTVVGGVPSAAASGSGPQASGEFKFQLQH